MDGQLESKSPLPSVLVLRMFSSVRSCETNPCTFRQYLSSLGYSVTEVVSCKGLCWGGCLNARTECFLPNMTGKELFLIPSYRFQLTYLMSRLRSVPRDHICTFLAISLKSLHFQQQIQWFLVILCFEEKKWRGKKAFCTEDRTLGPWPFHLNWELLCLLTTLVHLHHVLFQVSRPAVLTFPCLFWNTSVVSKPGIFDNIALPASYKKALKVKAVFYALPYFCIVN